MYNGFGHGCGNPLANVFRMPSNHKDRPLPSFDYKGRSFLVAAILQPREPISSVLARYVAGSQAVPRQIDQTPRCNYSWCYQGRLRMRPECLRTTRTVPCRHLTTRVGPSWSLQYCNLANQSPVYTCQERSRTVR